MVGSHTCTPDDSELVEWRVECHLGISVFGTVDFDIGSRVKEPKVPKNWWRRVHSGVNIRITQS